MAYIPTENIKPIEDFSQIENIQDVDVLPIVDISETDSLKKDKHVKISQIKEFIQEPLLNGSEVVAKAQNSQMLGGNGASFYATTAALLKEQQIRLNELEKKLDKTVAGMPNGIATLDNNGKIPESQISATAITDTFVVNTEAAQVKLVAQKGDICIRSDIQQSFILQTEDATKINNWVKLKTPEERVVSFNGETGTVFYKPDWNASPENRQGIRNKPKSIKNPCALHITGQNAGEYDGSTSKTIHIPFKKDFQCSLGTGVSSSSSSSNTERDITLTEPFGMYGLGKGEYTLNIINATDFSLYRIIIGCEGLGAVYPIRPGKTDKVSIDVVTCEGFVLWGAGDV